MYVCPDHANQAVTVLEAAGFATHRLAGGTEVKRCGDGMDFTDPTAVRILTAPAPVAEPSITPHPAWCDRQNCAGRDEHRSVALEANPDGTEILAVRLWLAQLLIADTAALVEVEFIAGPDETDGHVLPLAQAIALSNRIRALVDLERGGRR
ncbi:hypothetical protein [Micromonospora sp. NPDC049374]|uniref:hypothetical protein n=1 Tax=Micromonospora sp. NPDC049374 TaxID=3154352 RepID=UPI00343A18BD